MKILKPVQRALNEEMPDVIALSAVKIQRRAPGRAIEVGEIRAVVVEVISLRPEMVVDHIETHGEFLRVRGIHELVQDRRTLPYVLWSANGKTPS